MLIKAYLTKIYIVILFFLLLLPVGVYGQGEKYTLLQRLEAPGVGSVTEVPAGDLSSYLTFLIQIIIGITGVLAVIKIIIGGLQYMSTDAISGKAEGKNTIQAAVGGLLLAIVAWIILNTINPDLLKILNL